MIKILNPTVLALCALAVAAPAQGREKRRALDGDRYVAMGSSFASGSGVAPYDPAAPARCQRSSQNYARQLAHMRNLTLVDVTCGGATTSHILRPWNELPPQIDALTPETALVTITIGGNDIGYIGGLIAGSCERSPNGVANPQPLCQMIAAGRRNGTPLPSATEEGWQKLDAALSDVIPEIRRRSPRARIIIVDYLTVLPKDGLCAQTPLSPQAAASGRDIAGRLARLVAEVARRNGAESLAASELSRHHGACAKVAWTNGFTPLADSDTFFVPYHPNLAGVTAVAKALNDKLMH